MRAVLLDVGDTLVHAWAPKPERFGFVCRGAGVPVPDTADLVAASRVTERFYQTTRQWPSSGRREWWRMHDELGLNAIGLSVAHARAMGQWREQEPMTDWVDPAARHLIQTCRDRGARIALVSNWDGSLRSRAGTWDLDVDEIVDSGEVGVRKPDPKIFAIALERLRVAPNDAVHLGDSYDTDVVGARKAGITAVLLDVLGVETRPCLRVSSMDAAITMICRLLSGLT